jgi:heme exporter protein B
MSRLVTKLWWLIHKDLISECRARQVWPTMLLLGGVVVLVFTIQMNLPLIERQRIVSGLLWIAVFFCGAITLDRSFAGELEDGCLDGLLSYPIPAGLVFLAKLTVNVLALTALECVLIPLFAVLSGAPLLVHPTRLVLVATLGNVGIAAVGTLLSAVTSGTRHRANPLVLLVVPLALPVLLGAAEATRLMMASDFGAEWLRWTQLLGAFATIFVTAGVVLFDFVVEE